MRKTANCLATTFISVYEIYILYVHKAESIWSPCLGNNFFICLCCMYIATVISDISVS
jgi:hypothetical protein